MVFDVHVPRGKPDVTDSRRRAKPCLQPKRPKESRRPVRGKTVEIWDVAKSGDETMSLEGGRRYGDGYRLLSGRDEKLAVASDGAALEVFDAETGAKTLLDAA